MHFTRIRLNGFKSFVDPTDLLIHDGLTGVVGPNGCGKSNLLEALRWVMGENRPTAMRGGGMEDVIFAGAASRPARNFAEVALVLDNGDRTAPSGFNDADQLEIIRRITRDAGSAYKVNGKDVRARDVSMLFADASTGAHSPALVRQGQISELINARPKARRRVLEEAAGISGLYQRRHEAELKLNGTETNLARVEDVLEQLRSQLATLARQARQARRYREIGAELRRAEGMLLYLRWKEAQDAALRAEQELGQRTRDAAQAQATAVQAARTREKAADRVPPLREEEAIAAAVLQRLHVERDTNTERDRRAREEIETLTSRVAQLGADIERESGLARDAGETIASLEWEQAQIAKAAEGDPAAVADAQQGAQDAAAGLREREAGLDALTEDVARLAARHQSAERLRDDATRNLGRAEGEAEAAARTAAESETALSRADDALAEAQARLENAQAFAVAAEDALTAADDRRAEVQSREAEARALKSEAEGEASALRAEVAALARLVARETGTGGQIIDEVTVEPGYEAALGAALADDLRAPRIGATEQTGWAPVDAYADNPALPAGADPLAARVKAPAELARRLSQIGVVGREAGAALQSALRPGQRLVSAEGDLWRWDGFRARAEDAPNTAALRLQQVNRLTGLKRDLEDAAARADGAARAYGVLSEELVAATEADREARRQRREADQALADASRALTGAEAERNITQSRLDAARQAVARYREEALGAAAQVKEAEAAMARLDDLDAARARVEQLRVSVEAARMAMMAKRAAFEEARRDADARTRRAQEVTKELSGWRHRRDTAGTRIAELESRRDETATRLETARAVPGEIAAAMDKLSDAISDADARRAKAADALAEGEADLREADASEREAGRLASEAREARARAEARAEAARDGVSAAAVRIDDDLETTPEHLLESLELTGEDFPSSERIETDVDRLKRQRDALGAVNLRAEEDAAEIQTEHDTLETERADLEEAVRKLRAGIASLNREGRERLLAAFDTVNRNFSMLFKHLFGGGEANLVMVESDDPLDAGLEIMCQPPGKKLATLSLLSGGEQTLTALSLIFAVFLANPSPICVLDEVDAPLDDANVGRFCDLLDEMTRRTATRFLIITHHAVTMSRMDRLFGVTMAEAGVSQLVSVDLKKAEALVA